MTGDAFKKVSPGQPLSIPAAAYNAFIDAALAYKQSQLSQAKGGLSGAQPNVLVRNESGQNVPRFGVLGIYDPVILPAVNAQEFQNRIALRGGVPQPGRAFCISQEPIAAGAIGRCLVSGPTPVKVSIYDPDPEAQWAEPAQNNLQALRTYRGGSMRILWREPGDTGVKWAIAVFQPNPRPLVRVRLLNNLSKDSGQLVDAELLTMGPDGVYVPGSGPTIKVGDLSGLGFSAPALTKATAELRFGVTTNGTFHEVIGIVTDVRC